MEEGRRMIFLIFINFLIIVAFIFLDIFYKQALNKVKINNKRLKFIEYKLNKSRWHD